MARDRIKKYRVTLANGQPVEVQAIRPWVTYGTLIFCGPDEQLKVNGKEVTPRPGEQLMAFAPGQWLRYELLMNEPPGEPEDGPF